MLVNYEFKVWLLVPARAIIKARAPARNVGVRAGGACQRDIRNLNEFVVFPIAKAPPADPSFYASQREGSPGVPIFLC